MKVVLPAVDKEGKQYGWQSMDVSSLLLIGIQKNYTLIEQFKSGNMDNLMFFYNKPPKWNECKIIICITFYRGSSICAEFQWAC